MVIFDPPVDGAEVDGGEDTVGVVVSPDSEVVVGRGTVITFKGATVVTFFPNLIGGRKAEVEVGTKLLIALFEEGESETTAITVKLNPTARINATIIIRRLYD